MLRINPITSAAGAKQYYTQALRREDYYIHGQEITGHWHGKGAGLLGLAGTVDQDRFEALVDNRHPSSGATLTARHKEQRRVGYDFTFSVPKSVSLLYALTGDPRLLDAFRAAVDDTMREMEVHVKTRVRKGRDEPPDRVTGNMVWADFIHTVGRPVDGVPDPDLHAHCVVFNATYDQKEQRWKAGQFHDLKRDAPYYDAAFHTRLAARLRALGFGVERNGKRWDVAGIPRELIEKFSNRTKIIEAKARELGITDPDAKGALGAKTRNAKARNLDTDTLQTEWEGRLSAADRTAIARVLSGGSSANSGERGITAEAALAYAIEHCFTRESVVSDKKLLATALQRGVGYVSPEAIKDRLARSNLINSVVAGRTLVTTREVLAEEQRMLAFARDGRGSCRSLGGLAAESYHAMTLNAGQNEAIRHVLTAPDRVLLIKGKAGTGKTTLMKEAVPQIERRSGKEVSTFAPTAAARDVLRKEGFTQAQTVAYLLENEVLQQRVRGQVLWIDEAGLLSVPDMVKVFALAERQGCRVILSGDSGQHSAVNRGDALRLLEARAGLHAAEVREIVRQQGVYKAAIEAFSVGNIERGFTLLDQLGWVREVPTDQLTDTLARDYLALHDQGEEALVVSPTHRQGREVTDTIRATLKVRGEIGRDDRTFWVLRNLYLTDAEKSDAALYKPGQVVQFFQHVPGARRGERFRIEGRDGDGHVVAISADHRTIRLPLDLPKRFQVYETDRVGLAAGDTIRITVNSQTEDGHMVSNGSLHRINRITEEGEIILDQGWRLGPAFAHLAPGYCVTSLSSQGKSPPHVLVAQGAQSFPASSLEQAYVSLSRGKRSARLYTDNKQELMERVKESSHRASATELLEGAVTDRIKPLRPVDLRSLTIQRFRRYTEQMRRVVGQEAALELVSNLDPERDYSQERKHDHGRALER